MVPSEAYGERAGKRLGKMGLGFRPYIVQAIVQQSIRTESPSDLVLRQQLFQRRMSAYGRTIFAVTHHIRNPGRDLVYMAASTAYHGAFLDMRL